MTDMKRIGDDVLYRPPFHEIDQPCLYAIVGRSRTLMIDGGVTPDLAKDFISAIRAETGRGVDFIAVTHWHWDHVFGLAGLDAPVIACANTAEHIRRMAGYASWSDGALDERVRSHEENPICAENIKKAYPGAGRDAIALRMPDIVFEGRLSLDLGGLTGELIPLPHVHTNDPVAIHVPERRLLFIGDNTCQNCYDLPFHYPAPAMAAFLDFISEKDPVLIMESHAEPATPAEFWESAVILREAAQAVLQGNRNQADLLDHLKRVHAGALPAEAGEIAEYFINGIGR